MKHKQGILMLVSAIAVTYMMYRIGLALGLDETGGMIGIVILVTFFGYCLLFNKYFPQKEEAK